MIHIIGIWLQLWARNWLSGPEDTLKREEKLK